MTIHIDSVLKFFEKHLVFSDRQYQWDNSGKQIYLGDGAVHKVGFALDPSMDVINQAIEEGCELLITHHPLFFSKIKSINASDLLGQKTVKAISNGLNIVSYHTSLDLADFSLNDYVASLLDAEIESALLTEGADQYYKFAVFVPIGHEGAIHDAIDAAGAGHVGNYSKVTFSTQGVGTFLPSDAATPFLGESGQLEKADEYRIETIVPESCLAQLTKMVVDAHPYEEVAYDVYPIQYSKPYGLGRVCHMPSSMTLDTLLRTIADKLNCKVMRHNATDLQMMVDRFAVITGSGASMWKSCLSKGVQVLLTGDMKHHDALDAAEAGVVIVDIGHYETEQIFMKHLSNVVGTEFGLETILIDEQNSIKHWGL